MVSVIIPNWNGLALLRPCLRSLEEQTYAHFEVIVVDNGSTDGSAEMVQKEFPWVRLLVMAENRGYAGGCNAGIRLAEGDLLVMLNNDTEVDPHWLEALVDALERHPEAGSAASRIMIYDRPGILHSAGDLYRRNGLPDSRGVWQPYAPPYDREEYVFGGCGGAVAYRREMLEEIGLFEERFFLYCEDVDLNWRAQLAGWKCIYVPHAVVRHHLSATGGGALASYYVGRNTWWVLVRDYPTPLLRRYWRQILAAQWHITKEALRAWRGKAARARLRGQVVGALSGFYWLGARRQIQKKMRVSLAYLESILE
ncbi:MAG: glycosyltransferase family 2 protein [Anaerolineae bacterium]|nr:glycosyltransferase family 2 protein [Anaerolineae bacterium]